MASVKDIRFSVGEYDSEGMIINRRVFLHFGEDPEIRVEVSDNIEDFQNIVSHAQAMLDELNSRYK